VAKKDPELADKLLLEAEAIASWVVAGAIRFHNEGLDRPASVEEARKSWKSDMDFIADFIVECCVEGKDEGVGATQLYQSFCYWAKEQGYEHPLTQTSFGARLFDRGYGKGREPGTGRKTYTRLRLRKVGEK
jgi:putative DNA primase/helicase